MTFQNSRIAFRSNERVNVSHHSARHPSGHSTSPHAPGVLSRRELRQIVAELLG